MGRVLRTRLAVDRRGGALAMKLDPEIAPHWFALPLRLRRRWWEETHYGQRPPSPELRKEVLAYIADRRDGRKQLP